MSELRSIRITITETSGSTPRDAGTSMVVSECETLGSIGGGRLEWRATAIAQEMLAVGQTHAEHTFILGTSLQQCCGGRVTLSFDAGTWTLNSPPARGAPIYLYGLGHVGEAVARAFTPLPVHLITADDRADRHADWQAPLDLARVAEPGGYHLIMTHDHGLDLALCEILLGRGDCGYVGLIGSRSKRARFISQLRAQSIDPTRLTCPIGLPGVSGKEPAVIAASVVAEVLLRQSANENLESCEKKDRCS